MDNKGQATAGEIVLIIFLFILIIAVGYYEVTKKDSVEVFKAGSQSISPSPVVHFGGCAIIKEYVYADAKNKPITNSSNP